MADRQFSQDDDIPRTFKREREAREREARQRDVVAQNQVIAAASGGRHEDYEMPGDLQQVSVTRLNVPFFRLAAFLVKCVLAGIPALLLLFVTLFGIATLAEKYVPNLIKLKILIQWQ